MRKTEGIVEARKYVVIQLLFAIKERKNNITTTPNWSEKAHCESKTRESWIHSVGKIAFTLQAS